MSLSATTLTSPVPNVSLRSFPARLAVPQKATLSFSLADETTSGDSPRAQAPRPATQNPSPAIAEPLTKSRRLIARSISCLLVLEELHVPFIPRGRGIGYNSGDLRRYLWLPSHFPTGRLKSGRWAFSSDDLRAGC